MNIVLFEPDIPQNTGSIMRLCACMGAHLHIIEPCGFPLDDKKLKRAGMDYVELSQVTRHRSWGAFLDVRQSRPGRLLLLTTKSERSYTSFDYLPDDMLLLGRESAGVPEHVRAAADASLTIPMQGAARSLNVALAASMVLGEALRQIRI